MKKPGLFVAAAILVAPVAVSAGPQEATTKNATAKAADPERMVCKRQALTGTRFARKICFSRAEWDAQAEQDRRALAEATSGQVQRDTGRN